MKIKWFLEQKTTLLPQRLLPNYPVVAEMIMSLESWTLFDFLFVETGSECGCQTYGNLLCMMSKYYDSVLVSIRLPCNFYFPTGTKTMLACMTSLPVITDSHSCLGGKITNRHRGERRESEWQRRGLVGRNRHVKTLDGAKRVSLTEGERTSAWK